jgi:hypothetical protein
MKRQGASKLIFWITLLFYLIYNTIFGWNKTPISNIEIKCDDITKILLYVSAALYIAPIMDYIEKKINEDDDID